MIGWLLEWLLQCLKIVSKSFENLSKIYQKITKQSTKIYQKWFKNRSESVHRAVLEGSWAILAPRWPQEPPKPRKSISGPPSWGPFWEPKSIKIGFKSDPKGDRFYDRFEDPFLERFGANLSPSSPPKPSPNGAKLVPKSMQVGVLI